MYTKTYIKVTTYKIYIRIYTKAYIRMYIKAYKNVYVFINTYIKNQKTLNKRFFLIINGRQFKG